MAPLGRTKAAHDRLFRMETINPPAGGGQRLHHRGMDFTLQGEGVEAYRWTAHLTAKSPKAPLTVEA
jgi:hypothetical protein